MKCVAVSVVTLSIVAGMAGCETKAGTGALIGGAAGAGIGAIAGKQSHGHTVGGALIGGAVGALGGALIGNELDKNDRDEARRQEREEAASRRAQLYESRESAITRQDVIKWVRHGDRDDIIIDRIDRSGTVFSLTSRDENALRDAGVSEEVIRAMKDTARR
jgi:uncharacterized protein YcfJ